MFAALYDRFSYRSAFGPTETGAQRRLVAVKADFEKSLADIDTPAAADLTPRIRHAASLRELWHLRAELFDAVALHRSQHEAERRMAVLNRHFPTRSPRSGFAPLE